jgi:hypothetical protein
MIEYVTFKSKFDYDYPRIAKGSEGLRHYISFGRCWDGQQKGFTFFHKVLVQKDLILSL